MIVICNLLIQADICVIGYDKTIYGSIKCAASRSLGDDVNVCVS